MYPFIDMYQMLYIKCFNCMIKFNKDFVTHTRINLYMVDFRDIL